MTDEIDDNELVDGFFKMLIIPEYWDKWWDEAIGHLERFQCREKKEAMLKILMEEFYLRRPEAFLKNNPEKDQQFHRVGPSQVSQARVSGKSGCSRCPKQK